MHSTAGRRVVRSMRESDLRRVLHIERRSFSIPWSEATFRGLLRRRSAALMVGEEAGEVVGYAVLWFAADEAELGDIAVLPESRGRGLGRWLLEAALAEAARRGARAVYLEVRESNTAARRLYERAGFDTAGVRPNYYTQPTEDAILMTRSVAGDSAR
ncbi:MAG: ribosomal protein S18-alanine N-acetyltransferase [Gemmatimonadales bacterium]